MKIEKLSKEQEDLMFAVKDEWLNRMFKDRKKIDREAATESIKWMYKLSNLKEPIIVFTSSPFACQLAVNYAKDLLKYLSEKGREAANFKNVRDQVWAQVRDQVRAQVGDQVWAQVRAQVRAQVGDQVGDQVRDQVWDQVWDQKIVYHDFSSYGGVYDFGWTAFFDFFERIGIFKHDGFTKFHALMKTGIYDMIQLDGLCVVCELPTKILRNANNAMHSTTESAIAWEDGYELHFVNGRSLSEKYFKSISDKTFKIEDFINEGNEEHKSTCIAFMQEKYGDEYLVNFFREYLKEIDTFVDKKKEQYLTGTTGGMNIGVYTLFKGVVNGEKIAYVRCYCPSTDRMFFLGVDDKHNTAKDAIGSLYRIPVKLKPHIKSIARQGERFSTILTDKGKEVLKSLSQKDIEDVTGLNGESYFNLINYEY